MAFQSPQVVNGRKQLIDWLATTPLLHSPRVLDIVTALTITLIILLALPAVHLPAWIGEGN